MEVAGPLGTPLGIDGSISHYCFQLAENRHHLLSKMALSIFLLFYWEAGSVRSKSGSQENRLRISLVEAILGYLSGTWFPLQSKSSVQPCTRPPA